MPFVEPIDNSTITDLFVTANAYSENWLGISLLMIIFFILLIRMREFPLEKSFAAASFITMILAIFLRLLGLVNDLIMGASIILLVFSLFVLILVEKRTGQFF